MQSIFRLPWCSEHVAPKMVEEPALDRMRTGSVVEIPVLNKLKRKRMDSSDSSSTAPARGSKKHRVEQSAAWATTPAVIQHGNAVSHGRDASMPRVDFRPASDRQTAVAGGDVVPGNGGLSKEVPTVDSAARASSQDKSSSITHADHDTAMADAQNTSLDHPPTLSRVQQVIENEFNVQILMKHDELRLIEQELAKCQIALEQLRRVEIRPYPGLFGPVESVSTGTGPSVAPPPGYTRPEYAAPYGVVDGPYARHYRQWLLQDPSFDSMSFHAQAQMEAWAHAQSGGRSTRHTATARKSISKPFMFPGSPAVDLQSIPNYPTPAPKDKSAPLVLRRSTDGQMVKLICNNCLRGNFSSIQGFLNHCRIAHKVDYKSHDAAAIDCGRPLDENEAANLPTDTQHTPAPKPSTSRAPPAITTSYRNLVHPLNTSMAAAVPLNTTTPGPTRHPVPGLASVPQLASGTPLTPSPQVPRLSAYFAKHHVGGDLATAAAKAKQKIDLGLEDGLSSPDTEQNSPVEHHVPGSRTVTGHARTDLAPGNVARPASRKGYRAPLSSRPRPSPLAPTHLQDPSREIPESPPESAASASSSHHSHLSPHTADGNPGLVSDHEGDDDHGSASEEDEDEHSSHEHSRHHHGAGLPVGSTVVVAHGTSCADHMEIDVPGVVDDELDQSGLIIRRTGIFVGEDRVRAQGSPSRKLGAKRG